MRFQKPLPADSLVTLRFFYTCLKKQAPVGIVTRAETAYVASILADYATPNVLSGSLPLLTNLSEFFDYFVFRCERLTDPELLEIAGAQNLCLNGFFRGQMKSQHNVDWYDKLGRNFYARAARFSRDEGYRVLFEKMSENFPVWTLVCSSLEQSFRERRFLLFRPQ